VIYYPVPALSVPSSLKYNIAFLVNLAFHSASVNFIGKRLTVCFLADPDTCSLWFCAELQLAVSKATMAINENDTIRIK